MAVTVEELQITIGCDATQAERVLQTLNRKVDNLVKKLSKVTLGGDMPTGSGGKSTSRQSRKAAKQDDPAQIVNRVKEQFNKSSNSLGKSLIRGMDLEHRFGQSLTKAVNKVDFSKFGTVSERLAQIPVNYAKNEKSEFQATPKPYDPAQIARQRAEAEAWINNQQKSGTLGIDSNKILNGNAFEKLQQQFNIAVAKANELKQKLDTAMESGASESKITKLASQLTTAANKAEKLAMQMAKMEDAAPSNTGSSENIRKTGEEADKAAKKVEKLNTTMKKSGKSGFSFGKIFGGFGKMFHKNNGFLSKFGATVKRVVMRMMAMGLVRGVLNSVTQGLQILTNASEAANKDFGKFTALGNAVKAQIGAAALTVLNALSSALYNIASAAITAASAVANFFATLSGGTYFAVKLGDSIDALGDSAKGAGGKAKGMLAAFDELNVIGNSGGGGGGGSNLGLGGSDLVQKQGDSWLAKLLQNEQFKAAGDYVANILNGIVVKIDGFFKKVQGNGYGTKFAQFLNGAFGNKTLFSNIGKTVGDGINAIFKTVYDFFSEFDARGAADSFALALNTALETTDWVQIGATIMLGVLDALEFVHKFIMSMNWSKLIRSIFNVIHGVIRSLLIPPTNLLRLLMDVLHSLINFTVSTAIGFVGSFLDTIGLGSLADKMEQLWQNTMNTWDETTEKGISVLEKLFADVGVTAENSTDLMADGFDALRENIVKSADATNAYKKALLDLPTNKTLTVTTVYKDVGAGTSASFVQNQLRREVSFAQFANGGIVHGETLAKIGEYAGAHANPEVIAPLSDLTRILENVGGNKASERTMNEQNALLRQQNSLLEALLRKDPVIKASPEFGQVIAQSQAAYARA